MTSSSIALLLLVAVYSSATSHAQEDATPVADTAPSSVTAAEASTPEPSARAQKYGPTKRGETLAQVAQQVSTDATINNEQMMWALYTANPKAFQKSKLNRLRAGVYLTVPTPEQARSIDATIAHREIENRTARPAPKTPPVKLTKTKTGELDAQMEEAKHEQEEMAKEQVFLKARLKEMENKIQTLLRENAERDAKLRAQTTAK